MNKLLIRKTKSIPDHSFDENYGIAFTPGNILKTNRKVGVELEANKGNNAVFINTDSGHGQEFLGCKKYTEEFYGKIVNICQDAGFGSDAGGVEIQTPPLKGKEFEDVVSKLCLTLKENNFITDRKCGTHIHIDANDFSKSELVPDPIRTGILLDFYVIIDPTIRAMLPKFRRQSDWCRNPKEYIGVSILKNSIPTKEIVKKMNICDDKSRRNYSVPIGKNCGVNLRYMWRKNKHIELRYHEGTLNSIDIFHWSNFNSKLIDAIANTKKEDEYVNLFKHIHKINTLTPERQGKILKLLGREFGIEDKTINYLRNKIYKLRCVE